MTAANTRLAVMTHISLLDLVPVNQGGTIAQALSNAAQLAAHVEALGFARYWVAEHHGMAGIGGAATAVVLAHVGAATSRIRIGAGGIMLPNHAPFVIAEQFGTLDALYPGRIDLGLGRAPGSDMAVARALRRTLKADANDFPRDVMEIQSYFAGDGQTGVEPTPGTGADVRLYILGSSLFGAQLAALLGLPFAFASHFAPAALDQALALYREKFRPSAVLDSPYAMCGFNVFAADSRAEGELIASSMQQMFVALRTGRGGGPMAPPVADYRASLGAMENAMLNETMTASAIGAPADVRDQTAAFLARTQADELILTGSVFDFEARRKSLSLAAEVLDDLKLAA